MARIRDDHSQPDLSQSDRNLDDSSTHDRNESGRSATGRHMGASSANERSSSGKNSRNRDSARQAATGGRQDVDSPSERNRSRTNTGLGAEQETGGFSAAEQLRRGRDEVQRKGPGTGSVQSDEERSGMSKNDTVDTSLELSERGGIRPENTDPAKHHDRSRDRSL